MSEPKKVQNPLTSEKVVENMNVTRSFDMSRDYSNINLEEPSFVPPPVEEPAATKATAPPPKVDKEQPRPLNPEMAELNKKDKEMSAAQMAKAILMGYEYIHKYPSDWVKISDKKILALQMKGELNPSLVIQSDEYNGTVRNAINNFNDISSGAFTVSREFKEDVTPILIRVLEKRGMGMTDENMLIFLFGQDIFTKAMKLRDMVKQKNDFIEIMKKATHPAPQQQSAATSYSAPKDQQQSASTSNINEEGVKEKANVTVVPPPVNNSQSSEKQKRPYNRKSATNKNLKDQGITDLDVQP